MSADVDTGLPKDHLHAIVLMMRAFIVGSLRVGAIKAPTDRGRSFRRREGGGGGVIGSHPRLHVFVSPLSLCKSCPAPEAFIRRGQLG
jgi:hypothetical protein